MSGIGIQLVCHAWGLVVYLTTKRKLDIPDTFEGLPVVVQRLPAITPL